MFLINTSDPILLSHFLYFEDSWFSFFNTSIFNDERGIQT